MTSINEHKAFYLRVCFSREEQLSWDWTLGHKSRQVKLGMEACAVGTRHCIYHLLVSTRVVQSNKPSSVLVSFHLHEILRHFLWPWGIVANQQNLSPPVRSSEKERSMQDPTRENQATWPNNLSWHSWIVQVKGSISVSEHSHWLDTKSDQW